METETSTPCDSWQTALAGEKQQPYFTSAMQQVKKERNTGKTIYPKPNDIFNAFKLTPFDKVKVVIIGQDPYHGPNQAHGLCFSVQQGVATPPSLQNIYKELHNDIEFVIPNHGCLEKWAEQGVLLLNATLTVQAGQAHSHANIGWEQFTDKVIEKLNDEKTGLVFLLWGSQAQRKGHMIDPTKHYMLKSTHPSPLSAHRGFLGCRHFSKTNEILRKLGKEPIDWSL